MFENYKNLPNSKREFISTTLLACTEYILVVGIDKALEELTTEIEPELLSRFPNVEKRLHRGQT